MLGRCVDRALILLNKEVAAKRTRKEISKTLGIYHFESANFFTLLQELMIDHEPAGAIPVIVGPGSKGANRLKMVF